METIKIAIGMWIVINVLWSVTLWYSVIKLVYDRIIKKKTIITSCVSLQNLFMQSRCACKNSGALYVIITMAVFIGI